MDKHSFIAIGAKICPVGEIPCRTGNKCIPEHKVCDSVNDCEDGSDEKLHECAPLPDHISSSTHSPPFVVPSSNTFAKEEREPSSNSHLNEVDNYPSGSNYYPHHHTDDVSRTRNTNSASSHAFSTSSSSSSSYHPYPSGKFH